MILNRVRPDILSLKPYKSARSLYHVTADSVCLDANEAWYEPLSGVGGLSRYSDQQPIEMMQALCAYYDVSSRNLIMGRGSDEIIDILIRAFCVAGVDNIITCPPSFTMYDHSARLQGAEIRCAMRDHDFNIDFNLISQCIDKNTKIIFLCNPNNPTGNSLKTDEILSLCHMHKDDILIVVDEAYIEFSSEESMINHLEDHKNLFILRTMSKSAAAAGLRCGVGIGYSDLIEILKKILPIYPIPVPTAQYVTEILSPKNLIKLQNKILQTLDIKKYFIDKILNLDSVQHIYPSDTNFVLVRFKDAAKIMQDCLAAGFILRDQSHIQGLENCIRIAIGSKDQMDRLSDVLAGNPSTSQTQKRTAKIHRKTNETAISVSVNLDDVSPISIHTGIGFYDHMLEQLAKHGGFSLVLDCDGDLEIDPHHTIEDCAIAIGQALRQAMGDKVGIARYGFVLPMDEALAQVALDLSGRYYLDFKGDFPAPFVGDLPTDMIAHIFRSLAENMMMNLHISVTGDNAHHMVEACFKAVGRSLRQALQKQGDQLPSTKGVL
jgi:histidinol-phosphate aminotransferase/imidazoleglycerol-phosphate dehydratase/histidinol-phosphatase